MSSQRYGVRAGDCGGPHLAVGIEESNYLKLAREAYSLTTLPCGPPTGEAPARSALVPQAGIAERVFISSLRSESIDHIILRLLMQS